MVPESDLWRVGSNWIEGSEPAESYDLVIIIIAHAGDLEVALKNQKLLDEAASQQSELSVLVKVVIGDINLECGFVEDGAVTYLNCSDHYEGLPEKVLAALWYAYRNFKFQNVLKIDANMTVVNFAELANLISGQQRDEAYALGHVRVAAFGINRTWHKGKCSTVALNIR